MLVAQGILTGMMNTENTDINITAPIELSSRRSRPLSAYDFTLDELTAWLTERGQPAFRARQVFRWLYHNLAESYDEMTVLPKDLRQMLERELPLTPVSPVFEVHSDDDETVKVLYRTADKLTLETVLMFYPDRATICVSCQVGCAVGCSFCATGMGGLQRNLTAGEMVAQIVDIARRSRAAGRPLTNLVMMGMGEPFHNYAATMKMIGIINDENGMNFGARRITISTSGVVPFIDKLADEPYQVNLAISIHAGNDELRSRLVPINERWPLSELIDAVRRYIDKTGRRVSFEYALMSTVNDSDEDARQLAARLKSLRCHVNVIPYNPTPTAPYARPTVERINRFTSIIEAAGIPATVRYSRGVEISAACGQLRAEHEALSTG
jgi:23S rRNA (adenine2503-C2)-methyltransferase